ncbi:unnamed protein product [Cercospora beticola]|nr:unnamed protein product [Cercospora beticola]
MYSWRLFVAHLVRDDKLLVFQTRLNALVTLRQAWSSRFENASHDSRRGSGLISKLRSAILPGMIGYTLWRSLRTSPSHRQIGSCQATKADGLHLDLEAASSRCAKICGVLQDSRRAEENGACFSRLRLAHR